MLQVWAKLKKEGDQEKRGGVGEGKGDERELRRAMDVHQLPTRDATIIHYTHELIN